MPKQSRGRALIEGTSAKGIRNIGKRNLKEGRSRTEKDHSVQPKDFSVLINKINAVIQKDEYLHAIIKEDKSHMIRLLGVKDCKSKGNNAYFTIELELIKKAPKYSHNPNIKIMTFILTYNLKTASVSSDYEGNYTTSIGKFVTAVEKALRK